MAPDFFQWNKRYSAWGMPLSSWSLSHLAPPFLKPSQLHRCHWQMDLRWQAQNCDQNVGPERYWCWVQRLSSKLGSCGLDEIGKHRCLTMPAVLFPWRSLQGGKAKAKRAVSLWNWLMNKWSFAIWYWPYGVWSIQVVCRYYESLSIRTLATQRERRQEDPRVSKSTTHAAFQMPWGSVERRCHAMGPTKLVTQWFSAGHAASTPQRS